jgi:hypothetical protein
MMQTKTIRLILAVTGLLTLSAGAFWRSEPDITMLVVPRQPEPVRIAQDMAARRPVLLVTYQTVADDDVDIRAWNGDAWVSVSPEAYQSGDFFSTPPSHTILVQSKTAPAPDLLIPDGSWCTSGNRLTSTEPRVMLHLLGRYFDISYNDWKALSWRYRLPLNVINPGQVNIPWWHFRGEDINRMREERNLAADMENWFLLDIEPPEPVEPVDLEPEPDVEPAETPAAEPTEEDAEKEDLPEGSADDDESVLTPAYLLEAEEAETDLPAEEAKPAEPRTDETERPEALFETDPPAEPAMRSEPIVKEIMTGTDPFTDDEIPAAAVVVVPETPDDESEEEPAKKPWWKFF